MSSLECIALAFIYSFFLGEKTLEKCFQTQRSFKLMGPLVDSEFYPGWIDNWGMKFQHRDAEVIANDLDTLLSANYSVNVYVFHGGTNFGFMNGNLFKS